MHDAYKLAGFKGNSVSAPYKLEEKIKEHALTDPKLLKTSKKVAKHIEEIAEDTLKNRRDFFYIVYSTLIIQGVQGNFVLVCFYRF